MKTFLIFAISAMLVGCATTKEWSATGGSRSDGVVRLSYEENSFEQPKVDEDQGVRLAAQRCHTWGYNGAEAFGGSTRKCTQPGGFGGCSVWEVTKEYQCTGSGNQSDNHIVEPDRGHITPNASEASQPPMQIDSTQVVLSAQKTSTQMGCGDVRSYGSAGQFAAICSDHDIVIECSGTQCHPTRTISSNH